eukprot:323421_1
MGQKQSLKNQQIMGQKQSITFSTFIERREYYLSIIVENLFRNECKLEAEHVSKDIIKLIINYGERNQYEKLLDFMVLKWKIKQPHTISSLQWKKKHSESTECRTWHLILHFGEIKTYEYKFDRNYIDLDRDCGDVEEYFGHRGTFTVGFDENNLNQPVYILCKGEGKRNHGTPGHYNKWKGEWNFRLSKVDNLIPSVVFSQN